MKKALETPMAHHKSTVAILILMSAIVVFSLLTTSCESKSGQLIAQPQEKVVILEFYVKTSEGINVYKVKRIEHGVVDMIYTRTPWKLNDTILYKFPPMPRGQL